MSIGLGPHLRMVSLGVLVHFCPACDRQHFLHMGHRAGRNLDWDHNTAHPTFSPEIRQDVDGIRCSYFITAGRLEYLKDCGHVFAGKVVDLPVFPYSAMATCGTQPPADPLS